MRVEVTHVARLSMMSQAASGAVVLKHQSLTDLGLTPRVLEMSETEIPRVSRRVLKCAGLRVSGLILGTGVSPVCRWWGAPARQIGWAGALGSAGGPGGDDVLTGDSDGLHHVRPLSGLVSVGSFPPDTPNPMAPIFGCQRVGVSFLVED